MIPRKKFIAAADRHMPRRISKRIMERGAQGKKTVVVVVFHEGKPTRVSDWETHEKLKKQTTEVQPWKHRKDRQSQQPDPLGAVDMGEIFLPPAREHIYE